MPRSSRRLALTVLIALPSLSTSSCTEEPSRDDEERASLLLEDPVLDLDLVLEDATVDLPVSVAINNEQVEGNEILVEGVWSIAGDHPALAQELLAHVVDAGWTAAEVSCDEDGSVAISFEKDMGDFIAWGGFSVEGTRVGVSLIANLAGDESLESSFDPDASQVVDPGCLDDPTD